MYCSVCTIILTSLIAYRPTSCLIHEPCMPRKMLLRGRKALPLPLHRDKKTLRRMSTVLQKVVCTDSIVHKM